MTTEETLKKVADFCGVPIERGCDSCSFWLRPYCNQMSMAARKILTPERNGTMERREKLTREAIFKIAYYSEMMRNGKTDAEAREIAKGHSGVNDAPMKKGGK